LLDTLFVAFFDAHVYVYAVSGAKSGEVCADKFGFYQVNELLHGLGQLGKRGAKVTMGMENS
jgi:hypothetical protein